MDSSRAVRRVILDRGRKVTGWPDIDWKRSNYNVKRLQIRIAKATKESNWRKVKRLQRLLERSFSARALAVRKVVSNKGRNTPGVDGIIWNTTEKKWNAIFEINPNNYKPKPLKRIKIPKSGKGYRPLSIPCKSDMAMQALYQLALDPVSETTADKNSYGFRKERSCHDAIEQCFITLATRKSVPYILEADIKSCFDEISHQWIMNNIPMNKNILRKFLKAGYISRNKRYPTHKGTPQGGIISPTIMNMTLDGIDAEINRKFGKTERKRLGLHVVRYADDFVVLGRTIESLKQVQTTLEEFLQIRGLRLSPDKTLITEISEGFDFLGMNLRKYQKKLIIKPSKQKVKRFLKKIQATIKEYSSVSQELLIRKLNPMIRGWCNYYRHVCSKEVFAFVDYKMFWMLKRWAERRHPKKNALWIKNKYWHSIEKRNRFAVVDKKDDRVIALLLLADKTKIIRHIKTRHEANPYLPEFEEYFNQRLYNRWLVSQTKKIKNIIKRQKSTCPLCHSDIHPEDKLELDHIILKCEGGTDDITNLRLLCYVCHKQRHSKRKTIIL